MQNKQSPLSGTADVLCWTHPLLCKATDVADAAFWAMVYINHCIPGSFLTCSHCTGGLLPSWQVSWDWGRTAATAEQQCSRDSVTVVLTRWVLNTILLLSVNACPFLIQLVLPSASLPRMLPHAWQLPKRQAC